MHATPGAVLDRRFRLVRRLGAGGMGEVWLAHQASLERDVALKILASRDEELVQRFQREARAVSKVHHDNVVVVFDTGTCADTRLSFIAMELLEGETLRARIRRGPASEQDAVDVVRQIASGLAAVHAKGIVHRDVKPENTMLVGARVKLLDFGIARRLEPGATLTTAGSFMGTPGYFAPEVVVGSSAPDPKSDVYALGVVFFELLAGAPPFTGGNALALAMKHVNEEAPRAGTRAKVSRSTDELVARMLEKDPDRRPTAAEVAGLLGASGATAASPAPGAGPSRPKAFESPWFVIDVDEERRFVRITRTGRRCEVAEVDLAFGIIGVEPRGLDPSRYAVLLDLRAARPRSEPEFEKRATEHLERLRRYRRSAVLVKSVTAVLQVSRNERSVGRETRVFQSEAEAHDYLADALGPGAATEGLTTPHKT